MGGEVRSAPMEKDAIRRCDLADDLRGDSRGEYENRVEYCGRNTSFFRWRMVPAGNQCNPSGFHGRANQVGDQRSNRLHHWPPVAVHREPQALSRLTSSEIADRAREFR